MKIENPLSNSEIEILTNCLVNYATLTIDYRLPLKHDEKIKLLSSILDKTEAINPLVVFTKKEYSVMLAAMLNYEDVADKKDLTQAFYKLEEKIYTKIG